MLRSNNPHFDGLRRHISWYLLPNDRRNESKFNMMYPTVLFIVSAAFSLSYAKDDRFKAWFDGKIKKIKEYATSLETKASPEETTYFGSLEQENSGSEDLLEEADNLPENTVEDLPENTVEVRYVSDPKNLSNFFSKLVPKFLLTKVRTGIHCIVKVDVDVTVESKDLGNRQLGKNTDHPMNESNLNDLSIPGLDKHAITKSDALAAAQQIAQRTGSIKMATVDGKIKKIKEYATSLETKASPEETTYFGSLEQENSGSEDLLEEADDLPENTVEDLPENTVEVHKSAILYLYEYRTS